MSSIDSFDYEGQRFTLEDVEQIVRHAKATNELNDQIFLGSPMAPRSQQSPLSRQSDLRALAETQAISFTALVLPTPHNTVCAFTHLLDPIFISSFDNHPDDIQHETTTQLEEKTYNSPILFSVFLRGKHYQFHGIPELCYIPLALSDELHQTFAEILGNIFKLIIVDLEDSDYDHPAVSPPVFSFPTLHLVHRWPRELIQIPQEFKFHLPHQSTDRHLKANDRWLRWVVGHHKVFIDMTQMPYDGPRHRQLWRRLVHGATPTAALEVKVSDSDHLDGIARAMTNDTHSRCLGELILTGITVDIEYLPHLPGGHYKEFEHEVGNMHDKSDDFYGFGRHQSVPLGVPSPPTVDYFARNSKPLQQKIIDSLLLFQVEKLIIEGVRFRSHNWWDIVLQIMNNKHIRYFRYNEYPTSLANQGPYGARLESLKLDMEHWLLENHTLVCLDVPIKSYPGCRVWWQMTMASLLERNKKQWTDTHLANKFKSPTYSI